MKLDNFFKFDGFAFQLLNNRFKYPNLKRIISIIPPP